MGFAGRITAILIGLHRLPPTDTSNTFCANSDYDEHGMFVPIQGQNKDV